MQLMYFSLWALADIRTSQGSKNDTRLSTPVKASTEISPCAGDPAAVTGRPGSSPGQVTGVAATRRCGPCSRCTGHVALACAVIYTGRRCANKVNPAEEQAGFITAGDVARPVSCSQPRVSRRHGKSDEPDMLRQLPKRLRQSRQLRRLRET